MISETLHRRNFLLHLQERPGYDEPVLLKEPVHEQLGRAQIAQLHNEYVFTRQLAHVPGVRSVYVKEGSESHPVLLLEYIQGTNLAEIIQGWSIDLAQKLRLAMEITGTLGRIHEAGVIHGDISSSNILMAEDATPGDFGGVTIIDFGQATTMGSTEQAKPVTVDAAAGSLAYISPEQTGRMNRPVDYRSDLYSLGVTLYELLANQLPFESDDPLEMIHSHLAQNPKPLTEIDAAIPQVLEDIVFKLLAKDADDRYQSTRGLGADLAACLQQLQTMDHVEPFAIGEDDFSERLAFSGKLYGRQDELARLVTTYDRVAEGNTELLFVAGYSGVGKTSLVEEIRGDVVAKGGVFLEGKFDQLQRTLPYSAWAQAFTQLVNNWLSESEATLAAWRETILRAVGDTGQILIDVIPTFEQIIGPQPEVPQLGGIENLNRFNYIFNRFISSLATSDHPLVVFLDDLQWIDSASLNLIEALMAGQSTSSFLLIGAYRDNEVGADHPLLASQNRMRDLSERIAFITLGDLSANDVSRMLAEALQLTVFECRDLSQVLVDKTAGNPFYIQQLLYALEADEELKFDRQQRRWVWADTLQQSIRARGSVVDLMIRKVRTLPAKSQYTLSVAACIGSRFEISTLSTVAGHPQKDILKDLNPTLQDELIIRSSDHYMFAHDHIQEAGYALIPKSDRPKKHLQIGRLLLKHATDDELDEKLFDIVGHLNSGRALINRASEKNELAALNLRAGQKAKTTSAYSDGKKYIEIGLDLLGPDSWQEQYELILSLYNEDAELAYLTGQHDHVTATAALIHANARSVLDRTQIYMTQIEAETGQYEFAKALEIGLDVLRELGFENPAQPTAEDNQRLKDKFFSLLTSVPIDSLTQLPEMSDERAMAASSLFASEASTAYFTKRSLFPILCYHGGILILEFGLDMWSPFFLGLITLINLASIDWDTPADQARNQIQFIKQLVELIRELIDKQEVTKSRTKCLTTLAFILPWIAPMDQSISYCHTAYLSAYETGDLLYGSYGANTFSFTSLASGMNLSAYRNQISAYANRVHQMGQKVTFQYMSLYLQTVQNFIDMSSTPHRLVGTSFNEDEWLPNASNANDLTGLHYLYVNKLILAYHFDVDDKLDEYAVMTEKFLAGTLSVYSVPLFHLYSALGKLRLVGGGCLKTHSGDMNLVNKSLHWMAIWSEATPSTFQHKFDLIAAEKARATGDTDNALDHFEKAIAGARESGFTHEEALANELYARFWLERGNERFASQFMREAHSLYRKWGALAKAEHLAKRYPDLLITRNIIADEPRAGVIFDQLAGGLDLMTILKASQAIAGEIELGRLLALLMTSAIENSGAQSGYLLLPDAREWMIAAQAGLDETRPRLEQPVPISESEELAQSIVNYVTRMQQTVLLDDAHEQGDYIDDPYIQSNEVKSLLCTPLVNQGETSAILYLENNLSPGVFTTERVTLLQLLSSQMAISIENARTHDQLEKLLEERSRALSSAEAQIRSLFDNSPLGIALSNFEGQFLAVNKAILDMLRISEEEMLQRHVTDFYADPGDRGTLLAEVQESGSVQSFGVQLIRNDGSSFFASFNMSRLLLGGNEAYLTMVEDVTYEITAEQEAATLEERERLARELHDSVSQTLFSAGMIADAMPSLWIKDQAMGQQHLEMLSLLVQGASAEMRSLLLELRPDTLRDQTLGNLLPPLAVAARARTQAAVSLKVEGDRLLPENVTMALHRIAQESLNNIAKHAEASKILIDLSCSPEGGKLSIKDDGRGFNPQAIPAGHLGVGIMRERAQQIGATLQIDSQPGSGTSIVISWPEGRGGE